jgi:hypothetical protein
VHTLPGGGVKWSDVTLLAKWMGYMVGIVLAFDTDVAPVVWMLSALFWQREIEVPK